MNLKLIFRIFAGLQLLTVVIAIVAPEEAIASFGIEYSSAMTIMIQFSIVTQLMVVLITLGLPKWLGHSLYKAALTYTLVTLLPVSLIPLSYCH